MQMRQGDVAHIARRNPQPRQLTHDCLLRVLPQARIQHEQSDDPGGVFVIVYADAGVGQHRSLISLSNHARRPKFQRGTQGDLGARSRI